MVQNVTTADAPRSNWSISNRTLAAFLVVITFAPAIARSDDDCDCPPTSRPARPRPADPPAAVFFNDAPDAPSGLLFWEFPIDGRNSLPVTRRNYAIVEGSLQRNLKRGAWCGGRWVASLAHAIADDEVGVILPDVDAKELVLIRVRDGEAPRRFPFGDGKFAPATAAAWIPGERLRLALFGKWPADDSGEVPLVKYVDFETREFVGAIYDSPVEPSVWCLPRMESSPDGKYLVLAAELLSARLYRIGDGVRVAELGAGSMCELQLDFTADGKSLYYWSLFTPDRHRSAGEPIFAMDLDSRDQKKVLELPHKYCSFIRLSPSGRTLAAGSATTLTVQDLPTGQTLAEMRVRRSPPHPFPSEWTDAVISDDDTRVVAVSADGTTVEQIIRRPN